MNLIRKNKEKVAFTHFAFEVTRRCNFKCDHCLRGDAQNIDLSEKAIDSVLDQTLAFGDILFTGGEPLMALDKIEYIIDGIIKRKIPFQRIVIISNGTQYNDKFYSVMRKTHEYMTNLHRKCFGDEIKMPKSNLSLLVSYDEFHKKYTDVDKNLLEIKNNLGDIAYIKFHNAGVTPQLLGRGKQLKCGAYRVKNKPCRIEVYGKNRKCYCPALTYGINEQEYITVCCDMYLTAKGILIKSASDGEYEEEDSELYYISDMNKKEGILKGIDRFNLKYPSLCLFVQKEVEAERERLNNSNVEAIYKKIQVYYNAYYLNKDIKNSDEEEEDDKNYEQYVYKVCSDKGKTKEEKDFLFNISLITRDENAIIKQYENNKEDLYLAYPYLTKEQRQHIADGGKNGSKLISLNYEKKCQKEVETEYSKNSTIEMLEAIDRFYNVDMEGKHTQKDKEILYTMACIVVFHQIDLPKDTSDITNINIYDTEEYSLYTFEQFYDLLEKYHNRDVESVKIELEKEKCLRLLYKMSMYGYKEERFIIDNLNADNFNAKALEFFGYYNCFIREVQRFIKNNIVPENFKENIDVAIGEFNRMKEYYENLIAHPFLAAFDFVLKQGMKQLQKVMNNEK